MSIIKLLIATFILTAILDIILRIIVENYYKLPKIIQSFTILRYLIPYFEREPVVKASLAAGLTVAIAQFIIISIWAFPKSIFNIKDVLFFLMTSFIVGILFGQLIKWSNVFPNLAIYYKNVSAINAAVSDGVSVIIVQVILLLADYLRREYS